TGIPPVDSRLVDLSDTELQSQFLDCATAMYTMRVGLPAHPDYLRFTADPQVRTKLDTVSWLYPSNTSHGPPLCGSSSKSKAVYSIIIGGCSQL
ncbi:hypothetical protein FIBSPDRAFT_879506, partial [Athelia psychrophila]